MHNPLRPHRQDVSCRTWGFYTNTVAASALLTGSARQALYRRLGIDTVTHEIAPGCYFHSAAIQIGERSLINHGCHFENVAPVYIGRRCAIGMRSLVITSTHQIGEHAARAGTWGVLPVRIDDGCWLGAGVIVLPGVTIGPGCVIAAGAVIREDCEPDGLYAGVPARRVRDLDSTEPDA